MVGERLSVTVTVSAVDGPPPPAGLTELFGAYLRFYEVEAGEPDTTERFLAGLLQHEDALIWLAHLPDEPDACGFALVYPRWSSLGRCRVWQLNDLYVAPDHRMSGVAQALLETVRQAAKRAGAASISLETAPANASARRLYARAGYANDISAFLTYRRVP